MGFFLLILISIFVFNAIWWVASSLLSWRSRWRYVHLGFMVFQIAGLAWLIIGRASRSGWDRVLPKFVVTALTIWHMMLLPIFVTILLLVLTVFLAASLVKFVTRYRARTKAESDSTGRKISRREFVGAATAIIPTVATFSLTGIALKQLTGFRVRRLAVPIPDLPADLHGMTIAQVSDLHVGRFTSGKVLRDAVRVTNELRADLVLLTGDLINDALADLDTGINLVHQMEGRCGLYLIEGNHDLIENGPEFERRVKASGIPFLLDESTIVSVRGTPVQLFGLRWVRAWENRDLVIANAVKQLLAQRQKEAFPILLAHHPHAFDAAAEASLPLTLSGHTHGGQLMLNEQCGFGPALFRYWSGLYTRGQSKLIVSNGVGNWFPLRINAPAEIIHVTLVRQ